MKGNGVSTGSGQETWHVSRSQESGLSGQWGMQRGLLGDQRRNVSRMTEPASTHT